MDSVRKWGNTATHDLAPINKDLAFNALEFTYQLLQMVYAFPGAALEKAKEANLRQELSPLLRLQVNRSSSV